MKIEFTKTFIKEYRKLSAGIQKITYKNLALLLSNSKHPSLHVKKMNDPRNIWEGRVTDSYRFTFQIKGDTCLLRRIGTHDMLRNP
jgi:mRNA-degrading endonuclease RelE of RelBE toxin-antitoxin system